MGQSHTYGRYYKILDCKGEALFSTLLMKNAETSLVVVVGGGGEEDKRVSMN